MSENAFPTRIHYAILGLGFLGIAIFGSLAPLRNPPNRLAENGSSSTSFLTFSTELISLTDIVSNTLLFLPIGFCLVALLMVDRKNSARLLWVIPLVLLSTFAAGVALEVSQVVVWGRVSSALDLVAQLAGTLIGIALWLFTGQAITTELRAWTKNLRQPATREWLLLAYSVGLLVYTAWPLDITISLAELADKYHEGGFCWLGWPAEARPMRILGHCLLSFGQLVPVGLLSVIFLNPYKATRRSFLGALLGTLIYVSLLFGIRTFVASQVASGSFPLCATAGGITGCLLGRWLFPQQAPAEPQREMANFGRGICTGLLLVAWAALLPLVAVEILPLRVAVDQAEVKARAKEFRKELMPGLQSDRQEDRPRMLASGLLYVLFGGALGGAILFSDFDKRFMATLLLGGLIAAGGIATGCQLLKIPFSGNRPDLLMIFVAGVATSLGYLLSGIIQARVGSRDQTNSQG